MPTDQEQQSEIISRERYEAVKRERDEAKAQAAQLGDALKDHVRRDKARVALKGRVADPDTVADLLTPFLKDVEPDQVAAHVTSEEFKPRLSPFQPPAPPPAPTGEGEGTPAPAIEPTGFGAGPSPGGDASAPSPEGGDNKIHAGSPEWRRMIHTDPAGLKKAYEENRVVEPAPLPR